ncbi:ABC transporter permease [Candidatus Dependentiae bacterium]|nr:ABC transporter permease [Candidatus Dependentiae bacterium]
MSFSFRRVYAVMLRNFYTDKRSTMRITEIFYYPAIDITLWGITTQWLKQDGNAHFMFAIATSLVLWQVVTRGIYEISIGAVEEIWNRSIINLFGSPLQLSEWMVALTLCSIFKIFIIVPYGALLAWLIYKVNIFSIGLMLIPYIMLLLGCGWIIGFLGASIIMRWGRQAQSTPWMVAWFFAPLCAVFYPLASLPATVQTISYCIPITHVFEAVRHQIITGAIAYNHLVIATGLMLTYLTLSAILFHKTFARALRKGLSSLE